MFHFYAHFKYFMILMCSYKLYLLSGVFLNIYIVSIKTYVAFCNLILQAFEIHPVDKDSCSSIFIYIHWLTIANLVTWLYLVARATEKCGFLFQATIRLAKNSGYITKEEG